jgi:DNA-binding NarL/FixJ family response regulator
MSAAVGSTISSLDELRIMVVDDHRAFADLLSFAVSTQPEMTCVGTATSAAEGVAMAVDLRPGVIVMDIEMPRQDGLAATRRIREVAPDTVIVVVSAHRDPQWLVRAAQAGASAFVPKDGSLDELLDVLRRVRHGSMLVAPSTFGGSAPPRWATAGERHLIPTLTHRESEVLACLGKGLAPKAIARVLGISVHTCRGYVKALHGKLGVCSQLEAVVKAQQLGLLDAADG